MAKTESIKIDNRPIDRILSPFQEFFQREASSGILLMIAAILALIWANSPWADSYYAVWQTNVTFSVGSFKISKALLLWINDGLMAVFFFIVGLEIKREVMVGELATPRRAILPIIAAIGGMLVPAGFFILFNPSGQAQAGWGIPMATDIAFALGILSLLGKRVPLSLKVFLTAVAIVDDLGAVLVIALFYTSEIVWGSLLIGAIILIILVAMNRLGVRNPLVYTLLGLGLWVAFLKSGVHATIAGVLLAMTIPVRTRINTEEFFTNASFFLNEFRRRGKPGESVLTNKSQRSAMQAIEDAAEQAQTPLQRLEHNLHPWVGYFVMPVFAFANAGLVIGGDFLSGFTQPVTLGVMAGLIFGKQTGIFIASYLTVKLGWSDLPAGMTWLRLWGLACLAGIGFTMSLFIAGLAFGEPELLTLAKSGILVASLISGIIGAFILSRANR
ncbi:MAG TPA: Na+/H+ antiporter NhaA [Anaerolineales bacterium]|nr:Na+/H+ antiporter NhaA [Anaerolineales bacterium]